MVNDTSTLNGALSQLGETMADNLVAKGVTGASASDGLTTLAGKILQVPGGGGTTYFFKDDCTSDNTSNYATSIPLRNNGTSQLTYVSNTQVYQLINKSSGAESFIEILPLQGITDDFKFIMTSKADENCNSLVIYFDNDNWYSLKVSGSSDVWVGHKINGTYTENNYITSNPGNSIIIGEYIVDNTNNLFTINFRKRGGDLILSKSQSLPTITSSTKFGLSSTWSYNRVTEIYEMKATYDLS